MIHRVHEIINTDLKEILGTEKSLQLLKIYSALYLGGGQPRFCSASQTKYYNELKANGMEKAIIFEEVKNRTLIPNWNGLLYTANQAYSSEYMTDKQACKLLDAGTIKEKMFVKLPDGWKPLNERQNETIKQEYTTESQNPIKQKHNKKRRS